MTTPESSTGSPDQQTSGGSSAVELVKAKAEEGEITNKELFQLFAIASPHIAQAMVKSAEQESVRQKNELCWWSLPFLITILFLGGGVLWIAGMAMQQSKPELAVNIIGYLLTFLGGITAGRTMNRKLRS